MPNVPLTARLVLCICSVCHDHNCAEDNNRQLCFHDDFSPVIPLPAQIRAREIESLRRACVSHETRIPSRIFLHAPSRPRHHCVDWGSTGNITLVEHRSGVIAELRRDRGTAWRQQMIDARLRKCPRSATDDALHLCKSLLAGDSVIGAIRFTRARQGSHSRLHGQPHVDERFLGCCN